jgi:hypothetical protein
MPPPEFPSTLRLLRGFVIGCGYLALMAATLAGVTEQPYLACLGMVLLTGLTLFVLALLPATLVFSITVVHEQAPFTQPRAT